MADKPLRVYAGLTTGAVGVPKTEGVEMDKQSLVRKWENDGGQRARCLVTRDATKESEITHQVSASVWTGADREFVQVKMWIAHDDTGSRWTEILWDEDHFMVASGVGYTERDAFEMLKREAAAKGIEL